jgi:hypothetical protein
MAKTNTERQRDFRKAQTVRGKVLKQIWVDAKHWPRIEAYIARVHGSKS